MYGKIILTLAFIAFTSVQIANSLKCQTCSGVDTCKNPKTVECNATNANLTYDTLSRYYYDIKPMNSRNFSCFIGRYKAQNVTALDVRGCIMTGAVDCITSHTVDETLLLDKCDVCKKDMCNSVATYSSSIVTMISLLVLAKAFVV